MNSDIKHYPRVLLVNGDSLGQRNSGGITLTNLFHGWPTDRIAEAYCASDPPDPAICPRSWPLTLADIPVDRFVRRLLVGQEDRILGKRIQGIPSDLGNKESGGGALRGIACAWADLFSYRMPKEFWNWIEEFRPEVIYSRLGTIRLMNLVLQISKKFSLPIVPHFMDDWPSTHYRSSVLSFFPRLVLLTRLRAIIRRSPVGMAISDAMAEEYERRYGIKFRPFVNSIQTPRECPPLPELDENRTIKFLYVGGLHLNRWRALENIGRALAALRREGFKVEAEVYAPTADLDNYGAALKSTTAIRLSGYIPSEEVPRVLLSADVLIHVESFDDATRQYVRYSLSAKIPQYMATGRPILAYGPTEVASCRYIQEQKCGLVLGRDDFDELISTLRQLVESRNLRETLGCQGWERAIQQHSVDNVCEQFRSVLNIASQVVSTNNV